MVKIEIFIETRNYGQNRNWSKTEILIENRNDGQHRNRSNIELSNYYRVLPLKQINN